MARSRPARARRRAAALAPEHADRPRSALRLGRGRPRAAARRPSSASAARQRRRADRRRRRARALPARARRGHRRLVLRALVPLADASSGRLLASYVPLPVGIEDPRRRHAEISRALDGLRSSGRAVAVEALVELDGFAPASVISQAARLQARQRAFNVAVTNIPGPQGTAGCSVANCARSTRRSRSRATRRSRSRWSATPAGCASGCSPTATRSRTSICWPARSSSRWPSSPRARRRNARASSAEPRGAPRAPAPILDNRRVATLRLALCQLNPTVGDIAANEAAIAAALEAARDARRRAGAVRRARGDRLSARGSALQGAFPARRARGDRPPRGADATGWWRSSASPSAPRTSTTPRPSSPTGAWPASTARSGCPTTASSTSSATSRPARPAALIELGEHRVGVTICEDIWQPGPPCSDVALAGATLIVNLSASPYHAGKGLERELMVPPARPRARRRVRLLRAGRRPGRAGLRRPLVRRRPHRRAARAGRAVRGGAADLRRRPRRARRRAPAQLRSPGADPRQRPDASSCSPRCRRPPPAPPDAAAAPDRAAARAGRRRDLRRALPAGCATTSRKNGFAPRRPRALRRDRLRARRDDRRRRARARRRSASW